MNLYESIKNNLNESEEGIRKKQLINNIEAVVYEYDNGINDGVSEPFKSEDELVDYVYSQIFDMKDNGEGSTRYATGICDDLKYLGKDYIVDEIKRIGNEAGVVQNLNESEDDERFVEVDHKSVTDYDGFTTEYTWYKDKVNNTNVFVFGDRDVYKPTDGDYDWQEENDEVAKEWFDSYEGFNESEDKTEKYLSDKEK